MIPLGATVSQRRKIPLKRKSFNGLFFLFLRFCCKLLALGSVLAILRHGPVAQLGERVLCKHEVSGSIPLRSTISQRRKTSKKGLFAGKNAEKIKNRKSWDIFAFLQTNISAKIFAF